MQGSHVFRADGAVFDEGNLVSHAGLVPVLTLDVGLVPTLEPEVDIHSDEKQAGRGARCPVATCSRTRKSCVPATMA